MKKNRLIYRLATLPVLLSLAACTAGEDPSQVQTDYADKTFTISVAPYEADWSEGGRAATVMDDEQQKKIHSLLYLFYRSDGHLSRAFYEEVVGGLLEVQSTLQNFRAVANYELNEYEGDTEWNPGNAGGTLYILANAAYDSDINGNPLTFYNVDRNNGEVTLWVEGTSTGKKVAQINTVADTWISNVRTVGDFQMNTDIPIYKEAKDLVTQTSLSTTQQKYVDDMISGMPQHIVMFGSFQGRLDHMGSSMAIVLGRIAVRMRLALTGALGEVMRVSINDAALFTPLYYQYHMGHGYPYWGTLQEVLKVGDGITSTDGERSASRVYYTGENRDEHKTTTLKIEVWNSDATVSVGRYQEVNGETTFVNAVPSSAPTHTYTIGLAHDTPDEAAISGRTNLYRNTVYTFHIKLLDKPKDTSNTVKQRSVVMEEAGIIEVCPDE